MILKLILLVTFVSIANAHSWVHCVDYRSDQTNPTDHDPGLCTKFPRSMFGDGGFNRRPDNNEFGFDRGYNFVVNPDGSGARCPGSATAGLQTNYGGEGNLARYRKGGTYRLTWPAKNHVADNCAGSNQFIPDTSLDLYVFKQNGPNDMRDPSQGEFNRTPMPSSWKTEPHGFNQIDYKGFQRCPKFCENPDKVFCHGSFQIPSYLEEGLYTFQWIWEFNPEPGGDTYSTCWEAFIVAQDDASGSPSIQDDVAIAPPVDPTAPVCRDGNCCMFDGQCGDMGDDGTGFCHVSPENCGICTGTFGPCVTSTTTVVDTTKAPDLTPDDPTDNGWEEVPGGMCFDGFCCSFANGFCGDMGDDGSGWCHLSESNCLVCSGEAFIKCPNRDDADKPDDDVCDNCCDAGMIQAPGTGTLTPYTAFEGTLTLNCPDGFDNTFDVLCLGAAGNSEVTIIDGSCDASCTEASSASIFENGRKEGFDAGYAQGLIDGAANAANGGDSNTGNSNTNAQLNSGSGNEDSPSSSNSDSSSSNGGAIAAMVVIVILLCVGFTVYVMYKEHIACFKTEKAWGDFQSKKSTDQFDFETQYVSKPSTGGDNITPKPSHEVEM